MLKKVLHYNNVSAELLKTVPKLKKGEVVRFKSNSIKADDKSPRKFTGPYMENIPTTDTIFDKSQDRWVEIAYADQTNTSKGESIAVMRTIKFVAPLGEIACTGGIAKDEYLYYFLMLTNANGSNENRDTSKSVYFTVVDDEKAAKEKRSARNKKLDALNKATAMTPEEVRDFIASTGGNDKADLEVQREIVESWADKDPEEFLKKATDVSANLKATVKRALDQGVLKFDKEQMQFSWGDSGEPIMTVPRGQGLDHIRDFVETCIADKRYEKVIPTIKTSLKKK